MVLENMIVGVVVVGLVVKFDLCFKLCLFDLMIV